MNGNRRTTIQKRARALLEESSITSAPVPVERIAKALEAQLRFSPLDDELSGMIYVKDGIPIIGVNALHPHSNRRSGLASPRNATKTRPLTRAGSDGRAGAHCRLGELLDHVRRALTLGDHGGRSESIFAEVLA